MRILLTGSSGWLGRNLAPRLRREGYAVTGLDVAPGSDTDVVGSIVDRGLIDRIFRDFAINAVIHAGALHKPDIARHPAQAFVDVNVSGTLNLLEAAVANGAGRFVFTSTTSLMISKAIQEGVGNAAAWIDESLAPLEPRNIYGVTKLAAEQLCRLAHVHHALPLIILRTARFFPEDADILTAQSGENRKANELLHRRLTVEDAAEAHLAALERAPAIDFDTFIVSAPTPFAREDVVALKRDARSVIERYFPDAASLYTERGWTLPAIIDRVYDPSYAERVLGFRCVTAFADVLAALRGGGGSPVTHPWH